MLIVPISNINNKLSTNFSGKEARVIYMYPSPPRSFIRKSKTIFMSPSVSQNTIIRKLKYLAISAEVKLTEFTNGDFVNYLRALLAC